ncbi:hypothetical protein CDG76_03160 [Nostoc sp. 'Peltigera membranacea cyanobiont' 210A]|uniref:hypothetical protein n=1 Tax=Nostoc sp. 'Peltigera membranacea cyanobiont' 210A TaxID=2014529 RepID=UPI000B9507A0|nr:hypothetical protein [Nostoc sp. 'Peltigera membranacea cyanobiont' 210A]OYD97852.1 hypothetical protein CDG76_03160 [Nostoc sp. 'Peltigera membranacea cyanobiont' 210A]
MPENSSYNITLDNQDIIIKFNRNILDLESLTKFLEYLELETIRKRSNLTQEQATTLADEIDSDVWLEIKHKFVG